MDERRQDFQYGQMPRTYQQPQPMPYTHPQPLPTAMPSSVLDQTQKMTSTGFKPLSKEERDAVVKFIDSI